MKFANKVYDILKWVCLIACPAAITLILVVSTIWNIPCATQIVGTIGAVQTFIGACIGISSKNYTDGTVSVEDIDDTKAYKFELNEPIENIGDRKSIVLNVKNDNK